MWAPQSIELVCKMERIQRRASKYILNLPFHCQQSYKDSLCKNLLLLTYWHEYLDVVFLFKAVTAGQGENNPTVTPPIGAPTRTTRYTSNLDITLFLIRSCKRTFQRSFFNRTGRIWNALAADLGLSVACSDDPDDPCSFKSLCLSCNTAHNLGLNITCCF